MARAMGYGLTPLRGSITTRFPRHAGGAAQRSRRILQGTTGGESGIVISCLMCDPIVRKIIILGGGSAGLMSALALKTRLPRLDVRVIRSKDIGVIGVGEGSTPTLTSFLHGYLRVGLRRFFEVAQPTWKLGLKFLWGPRPHFYYPFGPGLDTKLPSLPKAIGFYCRDSVEDATPITAMMSRNKVFP